MISRKLLSSHMIAFLFRTYRTETFSDLEMVACEAMCATLGCGKIFDPTGMACADIGVYGLGKIIM